jgi:uncharacterized protein with HEPN domain
MEPWPQIRSIGNRIRHEYLRLDDAILWAIITNEAHALKAVMDPCWHVTCPKVEPELRRPLHTLG